MDEIEAGRYWDKTAESWTRLSRAGYDVWRDLFNTPAFFSMLPDVTGLAALDIGCGEGYDTRLLSLRAASVCAIDISPTFVRYARAAERERSGSIRYAVASALRMPFPCATFDFATAFMSLMDMPHPEVALAEAFRVLKPGGFLQFSITHPCFDTPHRQNQRDAEGNMVAASVGRYFECGAMGIQEWVFSATPADARTGVEPFHTVHFHWPLSVWLNAIAAAGFRLERVEEPFADDEAVRRWRRLGNSRVVAYYLHVLCRKPIAAS